MAFPDTKTTTSTLSTLIKTYYDKLFLEVARPKLVAEQFADKSRDIPLHEGQTVSFQRYVPIDPVTSTIPEGSNPDAVTLQAVRFEKTLAKYANAITLTEEIQLMAIDDVLKAAVKEMGENMGQSINRLYRQEMAKFFYPMRVDNSSTYAKTGTVGATATTTSMYTDLSEADDFWNGGTVVFTSGVNKGISVHVTDFANINGVVTFTPALVTPPSQNDTFRIVTSTGITPSNVITCAAVQRAVAFLKAQNCPPHDGKYYIGIISPFVEYDFMNDSAWVNAVEYAGSTQLFEGEIGRWGGVRWVEDTDPWTEDAGVIGTYSAGGAVHHTPIFGRHAYAGVRLDGAPDKLFIKKPGPQDTSNPINAYSVVAWRVYFAAAVLNALWGVTLISGASTVA